MPRIVFFGSSPFSVIVLEKVLSAKYEVLNIVTTPDKPAGRGLKLTPTPIKFLAQKHGISVYTDIHDFLAINLPPGTLGLVAAHGRILGPKTLSKFNSQIYVIHPSLLPKYRGSSPLQQQILDGVVETGVTIVQADLGTDTGPIVAQEKDEISPTDTWITLGDRLFAKGAELFIGKAEVGSSRTYLPQDETAATYTKKLTRQDGFLPWAEFISEIGELKNYLEIENCKLKITRMLRAYDGWPGIWSIDPLGKRVKLVSLNPPTVQFAGHKPQVYNPSSFQMRASD